MPRPLQPPKERLLMTPDASVHLLMDQIEAVNREVGLPFGWFFLMTHGHWVDPEIGVGDCRRVEGGAGVPAGPRRPRAAARGGQALRVLTERCRWTTSPPARSYPTRRPVARCNSSTYRPSCRSSGATASPSFSPATTSRR